MDNRRSPCPQCRPTPGAAIEVFFAGHTLWPVAENLRHGATRIFGKHPGRRRGPVDQRRRPDGQAHRPGRRRPRRGDVVDRTGRNRQAARRQGAGHDRAAFRRPLDPGRRHDRQADRRGLHRLPDPHQQRREGFVRPEPGPDRGRQRGRQPGHGQGAGHQAGVRPQLPQPPHGRRARASKCGPG